MQNDNDRLDTIVEGLVAAGADALAERFASLGKFSSPHACREEGRRFLKAFVDQYDAAVMEVFGDEPAGVPVVLVATANGQG